jgi:putative transposase
MEYSKQGHCVYYARYHIVIATKYRRKIFQSGIKEYLMQLLRRIPRYYPEIKFIKVNGEEDHLHLLLSIPPKMAVADVVRIIKSNTAREIRKKFNFLDKAYWGNSGIWSNGYFVSTIGVNEEIIRGYIERQGQEDVGQDVVIFN